MTQPYFTPDVIDILTAYVADYVIPLIALAQATGRTTLKDYTLGVACVEAPAYDGTVTVTVRVGDHRSTRTLKYNMRTPHAFFESLNALAVEAACRAAGVYNDAAFILDLTSSRAAGLIASHPRTVRPTNVHALAASMIRRHSR